MNIVQSILTKNPCYTAGRKITVKGLMLHSVGCPQPNAQAFINNWNKSTWSSSCVHAFIDANNGNVYQTLPWNHRGWHCGSGSKGSANNTHIGVEMCEPNCIKYTSGSTFTITDKKKAQKMAITTYNSAVELFAKLCKQYNLDPTANGVIISHKEGCVRGLASNHGDPEHLWNQLGLTYTMDKFRKKVKKTMGTAAASSTKAESTSNKNSEFKVKVTDDCLNIRKEPNSSSIKVGQIKDKGIYTITKTSDKWGKLKSGLGWIHLDYTKKV